MNVSLALLPPLRDDHHLRGRIKVPDAGTGCQPWQTLASRVPASGALDLAIV